VTEFLISARCVRLKSPGSSDLRYPNDRLSLTARACCMRLNVERRFNSYEIEIKIIFDERIVN